MKSIVAVPARLESTRLPRKVLADIGGKAMLQRVLESCASAKLPAEVVLCTDSIELQEISKTWGFRVIMTAPTCTSGTDRIASVADQINADVVVNVQGDQPFIDPNVIDKIISEFETRQPMPQVLTPIFRLTQEQLHSANTVKTLLNSVGDALYFSRSAIPHQRDVAPEQWAEHATYWGHIGLYAYQHGVLQAWQTLAPSELEDLEKLEQLRFIDNGIRISTFEISGASPEVNVPEDLEIARRIAIGGVPPKDLR